MKTLSHRWTRLIPLALLILVIAAIAAELLIPDAEESAAPEEAGPATEVAAVTPVETPPPPPPPPGDTPLPPTDTPIPPGDTPSPPPATPVPPTDTPVPPPPTGTPVPPTATPPPPTATPVPPDTPQPTSTPVPPPPTSTPVPSSTPVRTPPQLLDPPENAVSGENRLDLAWDWPGQLGPNDYFQVEIRNRYNAFSPVIDEAVDPIDVAWVKGRFYKYDQIEEAYDREYAWRIIVVRGMPPKEKDWSTPQYRVWEPAPEDQVERISEPSEMRTLYVEPGTGPVPGTPEPEPPPRD